MLLVTPADVTGGWRWDDLVDALNETLDLAKRARSSPRTSTPRPTRRSCPRP